MPAMRAKYPGRCRACNGSIAVESLIRWRAGGGGAVHVRCPTGSETGSAQSGDPPPFKSGRGAPGCFAAKFAGRCRACHQEFGLGDSIKKNAAGSGVVHAACP